jgi:FlaG/FlaF family flagellin (archaellin)
MNHTTLAIVGMLAIAAALVGAIAVSVLPAAHAASYPQKDPGKKNSIDIEKSTTDFSFKQKLKNNCSGFATCANTATETLG